MSSLEGEELMAELDDVLGKLVVVWLGHSRLL
jgi:hypothetical protein